MYSTLLSFLFAMLFAPGAATDDTKVNVAPVVGHLARVQNVQTAPMVGHLARVQNVQTAPVVGRLARVQTAAPLLAHVGTSDPSNVVVGVVTDDKTVRRIGVTTRRPDEALAYHLSISPDEALVISSVQGGMPAAESGLTVHDVIVSVEGSVPRSSEVLRKAVQAKDDVLLLVRRGPKTVELRVPVREVTVENVQSRFFEELIEADSSMKGRVEVKNLFNELRSRAAVEERAAAERALELQMLEKTLAEASAQTALVNALKARESAEKNAQENALVEHARAALMATELAALEEARAKLARERANVEERRAEIEVLRGSIANVGDSERKNIESSLLKLRAASKELGEKQKMLDLKAGEALIRKGERTELVLPSDRTIFGFRNSQRDEDGRLEDIEERLDQLTAMTKEILGILTNRSAR